MHAYKMSPALFQIVSLNDLSMLWESLRVHLLPSWAVNRKSK